ncbi:MAG: HAD family phosphatase [Oculatellaceae cyanobacterium bins.114]|nr:HAD family phosphatase [Oculatellaceae cyanobacterium bins.114]
MLKALLFDLDGTIADTDPIHFQTWKEVLQEYGVEIDRPFYQANFSGRLNPAIVKDVLPHLSADEGQEVSDRKEAAFRQRASQLLTPMPGLMEVLTWMDRQALQRAVVTNAPVENAQFMMESLGLIDIFPLVVLGQELPKGKPDPMPYQVALERLGVVAEEAIAFEDSPSGVRSAVAAGIPTVAIASTHTPDELYPLGATLVVADFTDPRLLHQLQMPVLAR